MGLKPGTPETGNVPTFLGLKGIKLSWAIGFAASTGFVSISPSFHLSGHCGSIWRLPPGAMDGLPLLLLGWVAVAGSTQLSSAQLEFGHCAARHRARASVDRNGVDW